MTMGRRQWSRRNIPEELWPEILSRLPVKTLLRFRAVSKQWRFLIDDPNFARSHLRLFSKNCCGTHLLVQRLSDPLQHNKAEVRCIQSLKVTSRLHIPLTIYEKYGRSGDWYAFSTIDGLFMLKRKEHYLPWLPPKLMLWNPATRKTLMLPPYPGISAALSNLFAVDLGLGFDPSVRDYKHVRVIQSSAGGLHSVAVYSLATNTWRMTRCDQGILQKFWISSYNDVTDTGLCLKGFLFHLTAPDDSPLSVQNLVSFDFRSETLASITLPVEDDAAAPLIDKRVQQLTLVDDGSSLAVVTCKKGSGSIWVLEGLGVHDVNSLTWSKRYSFSSMIPGFDCLAKGGYFFYLIKNSELLIRWNGMITSYNLETNKERVVDKRIYKNKGFAYIESLVAIPEVDR